MIEEELVSMVDRFNRHTHSNPGVFMEIKDITRVIEVHFTDGKVYMMRLKDGVLTLPVEGDGHNPDIKITTDKKTFESLIKKELGPMKALVTHKLTIDATLEDKILLRKLL